MTSPTQCTVYARPGRPRRDKTEAHFDANGIRYTAVDITEVPAAPGCSVEELGYSQVPFVVNDSDDQDHRAGLRRDRPVQANMNHAAA